MKTRNKVSLAAIFFIVVSFIRAEAQLSYSVTDLGTLGGNTSTANSVAGHGMNAAGMIVGSSTTSDNSEHAFLYAGNQMFDLNTLCDLSQSDFKVLTVARTISDSCVIIGDGITKNGDKHAFMLTPLSVAGGEWNYQCCQWVWIQEGGGWWWEENCGCYKWHGPPGNHPPCPPEPPPCWWLPLPCPPPCHRPTPTPTPPPPQCWCCINGQVVLTTPAECREREGQCYATKEEALRHCKDLCWCCINGHVVLVNAAECKERGGQCYGSREEALRHCGDLCWCCINGHIVQMPVADCRERNGQCYPSREEALRHCRERTPTPPPNQTPTPPITYIPGVVHPTPTLPPAVRVTPTPPRRRGKPTPTPKIYLNKPLGNATATPSTRGTTGKKRASPTPYGKP